MGNTGLRTSLIWHDEVMGDVVHDRPAKVTIGSGLGATFTTPDVGTQAMFTMFTPGKRGYLLTLAAGMRGTVCIGGVEHEVGALVAASGEPFHATPLSELDWGVIELDDHHKLFFQFVPLEEAEWNLGHPMVLAAVGGFALSFAALTGAWAWKGVPLGEAAFRAGSLSSLAIGFAGVVRWVLRQDNESRASLAFSVMLHAALLFATFQLVQKDAPFEWPKQPSVSGGYLVKMEDPKPAPVVKPVVAPTVKPGAAILPPHHGWERPHGKRVDRPTVAIAAQPDRRDEVPAPGRMPRTKRFDEGVLAHDDVLDGIAGRSVTDQIEKLEDLGRTEQKQKKGRKGPPKPGGLGGTVGAKAGDGPQGEQRGTGDLATGPLRPSVCIGAGCGGGGGGPTVLPPQGPTETPGPTLDKDDVDRLIKAHHGLFETCYQKALDKNPQLAGDVTMRFEIGADGRVKSSRATGGSLAGSVGGCMQLALGALKFPARGGAIVNYPFVFSAAR